MTKISKQGLAELIQPYLNNLVDSHDAVDGALIVTVDGNLIAKQIAGDSSVTRIATMGSSLMSLGDTITGELEMGGCKNVLIENEGGYVAFMHVNTKLVLVSTSKTGNSLGMLLSASRNCAALISQKFKFEK